MSRSTYDRDGQRKYLSRKEGQKFLTGTLKLPPDAAVFCLTLYYTGCRISEALNLTGRDLDPELEVVRIQSLKKRGQKVYRRIPIPPFLAGALVRVATGRGNQRIWPYSRTTGWRLVKAVMRDAEISGVHATAKGLRHSFGVRGAVEQVPIHLIQAWMGHADLSTTAIYLDVRDDEERALIEKTWG